MKWLKWWDCCVLGWTCAALTMTVTGSHHLSSPRLHPQPSPPYALPARPPSDSDQPTTWLPCAPTTTLQSQTKIVKATSVSSSSSDLHCHQLTSHLSLQCAHTPQLHCHLISCFTILLNSCIKTIIIIKVLYGITGPKYQSLGGLFLSA